MSRVLISTLGVTDYVECNYCFNEVNGSKEIFNSIRFIQEAVFKHFCKNWSTDNGDRLYILCTDEAKRKNWVDNGHKSECEGLRTRLQKAFMENEYRGLGYDAEKCFVEIQEGNSEEKIWSIFETIYSLIRDDDEIYFDITHGFRSLPMLVLVVLQYARELKKNISIKAISYGAIEALGSVTKVKEMMLQNRNAPVFDLTNFVRLMDWTDAAGDFVDYGQTTKIGRMLMDEIKPILKKTRGQDIEALSSRKVSEAIRDIAENIRKNDLYQIYRFSDLNKRLEEYSSQTAKYAKPFKPVVDKIKNKIAGFDENSLGNVFHAVRWCVNHGMYQNAYSILLEGCISIALDAVGEQWKPDGVNRKLIKKMRKIPTAVAGKRIGSIKKIEGDASEFPEICEKIDNILTDETALVFCNLNDYRNSYMHCGTGNRIPSNLLKEIYGFVDKMEKWFNDLEENRVEKESIIN